MWMLAHPENPIVWTLHCIEIFIAKRYWFSAWRLLRKDIVQVGSFVGIIQMYLTKKKKNSCTTFAWRLLFSSAEKPVLKA